MANTNGRQEREAQREAVKTLAIAIGVREAARQLNLNEDTVCSWAKRGKWFAIEPKPQPPSQAINPQALQAKPSDALATVLSERKDKSKLHLSKYVEDASRNASETNGNLKVAPRVKDVAMIHQAIWPEKEQAGSGVMGGLRVYSQQTVIAVQGRGNSEPQAP